MKRRDTLRDGMDSDRVFGVRMSNGDHTFRTPGHLARPAILALQEDAEGALMGCMIGLAWFHPEMDLEAVTPSFRASMEEWRDYGDAVLLELDAADYLPAELDGLARVLLSEWGARMQVHGEAREQADFFAVTRGSLLSRNSTSKSDTLAVVSGSGS